MALAPYTYPLGENDQLRTTIYRTLNAHWRTVLCAWLGLWALVAIVPSLGWQQVNDPVQIHYVSFLMDHGMSPYRDLIEMNMPGIYLTNWTVMHVLGAGSLAWRVFDLGLMALACWAAIAIARSYDWFAGALAAAMFALLHVRDGAMQMGQRDQIIAVMLLCAHALLFRALRTGTTWLMAGFGLALGYAVTIKPTPVPYVPLLFVLAALRFRRQDGRWIVAMLWSSGGLLVPLGIVTGFLWARNSLADFVWVLRWTLPYYSTLGRQSWGFLLRQVSPSVWEFTLIALAIVVLEWKQSGWRLWRRGAEAQAGGAAEVDGWEMRMLALGTLFGLASYLVQDKGMIYHRYPFMAFAFLWSSVCMVRALGRKGMAGKLAAAGIAFGLILVPCYVREEGRSGWSTLYINTLTSDLNHLGGPALDRKVQCIATQADCATTLYRMQLVQSTGLFYDFLIFGPAANPSVQHWRDRFWEQISANPPDVLVVHTGLYPNNDGYVKLANWPAFANYIKQNFDLYTDREFPLSHGNVMGYRIYVRKGLAAAASQQNKTGPNAARSRQSS